MNVINLFPGLVINLSYSYSLYSCHQGVGKKPENMSPKSAKTCSISHTYQDRQPQSTFSILLQYVF